MAKRNRLSRIDSCRIYDKLKKMKKEIVNNGLKKKEVAQILSAKLELSISPIQLISLGEAAEIKWGKKTNNQDRKPTFSCKDIRLIIYMINKVVNAGILDLTSDPEQLTKWNDLARKASRTNIVN